MAPAPLPRRPQVGETIRRIRVARELSLADVARKAGVSVASLSRMETNKQSVDVSLLETLADILGVTAASVLGEAGGNGHGDPDELAGRLSALSAPERTRIFLASSRRRDSKQVGAVLDDLVSTVDLVRDELLQVQRNIKRRKR